MNYEKEISFGAFDSELMHQEIFIPEGFTATIDGNKIILTKIENEDERVRKAILELVRQSSEILDKQNQNNMIAWLEKQGEKKSSDEVLKIRQELYQSGYNDGYKHGCEDTKKQGEQKSDTNCLLSWSEIDEKMFQSLEGIVKDYWAKAEQEKNEIKIREASNVSYFLKTIQKSPLCWIKCSDGLPNKDGTYLVVTDGTHNDVYDLARYDSIDGWHKASEILYWMPIPQLNNKSIIEHKSADWSEEDERVRKALIKFHKSTIDIDGIKGEEILAWLENQGQEPRKVPIWKHWKDGIAGNGEGKPIYLIKDGDVYRISSVLGYECDYIELSDLDNLMLDRQGTSYTKRDVDDAYVEGMAFARDELERQGEQKPIDKIQLGKKYKCIASPRYSTFRRGNIYKPVDNFLCNLMNLCYECFEPIEDSEQKPTDEDMKEALRTEYEKGRADAIAQMQKEWSEEDEAVINKVESWLDTLCDYLKDSSSECIPDIKDVINKLNSLRHQKQWKPSDAQIRALEYIINNAHNTSYSCKIAKELLEQLKKLKGE